MTDSEERIWACRLRVGLGTVPRPPICVFWSRKVFSRKQFCLLKTSGAVSASAVSGFDWLGMAGTRRREGCTAGGIIGQRIRPKKTPKPMKADNPS